MKILVTGATGFVGRALAERLVRNGHRVTALVRNPSRAKRVLGDDVEIAETSQASWEAALGWCEGVVHLAGEPIFSGRWTKKRKRQIVDSRVKLTNELVETMSSLQRRPDVLVSASAVGYYGDRGSQELQDESPPGSDFLARLCVDWEDAAERATELGVRVATLRLGVVLGKGGGALKKMLPPFRAGVGGRLGSGQQYMSWIHLEDLVELIATAITDNRYRGAFNATAPTPVTNSAFTQALGKALGRPTILPVPGLVFRTLLGESAEALLTGQRVLPDKAMEFGFQFRFHQIDEAIEDILGS